MADTARGNVQVSVTGSRNNNAQLGGALTAEMSLDRLINFGDATAALQMNRIFEGEITVPQGSSVDLDLQTQVTQPDATIGADGLTVLAIRAPDTNTQDVTMAPDATNGWTAFIQGTAPTLTLKPGALLLLAGRSQYAVSASDKVIEFATGAGVNQTLRVVVFAAEN